jgi:hypothetical protein
MSSRSNVLTGLRRNRKRTALTAAATHILLTQHNHNCNDPSKVTITHLQPHCCGPILHNVEPLQGFDRVASQPLRAVVGELREIVPAHKQRSAFAHRMQVEGLAGVVAVAAAQRVVCSPRV